MSVTLPSDLIADVMRNADPARRKAAVAGLTAVAGNSDGRFAQTIESVQPSVTLSDVSDPGGALRATLTSSPGSQRPSGKDGTYQGFERMFLRNLFETLLPGEESGTFGGGPSAGVWRSMAADQLAGVYAKDGGIGIARMLEGASQASIPHRETEWPYFSKGSIGAMKGQTTS